MEKFTLHDLHVHTYYSLDSNANIEEYINIAINKGCKYFITTDHCDIEFINENENWVSDFKKEKEELESLAIKYQSITILQGIEAGYKKSILNKLEKILQENSFDQINLSIHEDNGINFYDKTVYIEKGCKEIVNRYLDLCYEGIVSISDFDVLSHFDYGFKTAKLVDPTLSISTFEDKLTKIMKELIKKDKTLEINSKVHDTIDDINHTKYVLSLYKKLGGKNISISSDAHEVNRYLASFEKYKKIVKDMGFSFLTYYVKREKQIYKI